MALNVKKNISIHQTRFIKSDDAVAVRVELINSVPDNGANIVAHSLGGGSRGLLKGDRLGAGAECEDGGEEFH